MNRMRCPLLAVLAVIGMCVPAFGEAMAFEGFSLIDLSALEGRVDDPKQTFSIIDKNGDGYINRAEFSLRKLWVFDKKDVNRDTFLGRDELPVLKPSAFDAADANGDGKLSIFEFNQAEFVKFDLYDRNRDGRIAWDEFLAVREDMKK